MQFIENQFQAQEQEARTFCLANLLGTDILWTGDEMD